MKSRPKTTWQRVRGWIANAIAAVMALYILSAPPILNRIVRQSDKLSVPLFYAPMLWALDNPLYQRPLLWYFNGVWGSRIEFSDPFVRWSSKRMSRVKFKSFGLPRKREAKPPERNYMSVTLMNETRTNPVTALLQPVGKPPKQLAVVIDSDDRAHAIWTNFSRSASLDLGLREGTHQVWLGYKWNDHEIQWEGYRVRVVTKPPTVVITSPKENVLSQPMIQLQGYSTEPLSSLRFDVINGTGTMVRRNDQGFVNDQYYDRDAARFTTNSFTCYDIDLGPGTNTIVLRCSDSAGNGFTTNLYYVFTTAGDTSPPAFKLEFPPDGACLSGGEFTLDGRSDDPTAKFVGLVSNAKGQTTKVEGLVERDGKVWIEHIPLTNSPAFITVIATDAAHNSSVTNITVKKSRSRLTVEVPRNELWKSKVTVSGFTDHSNATIWVNGEKAALEPNGRWIATNVPVTEGGTASFNVKALPNDGKGDEEDETVTVPELPVIWGEPSDFLKAGLMFNKADANKFNYYGCNLEVMNVSNVDLNRNWMMPKPQFRYVLRLFAKNGKEIPQNGPVNGMGQPLPSNLNIHHLGSQEIDLIDGILPFKTNVPVCFASVLLNGLFPLDVPGEYRLEARERLFRIEEDGRLTPFELPPVFADLTVADQDSQMVFFLEDLRRAGRLVWGGPLESLQVGLLYEHNLRSTVMDKLSVFLMNRHTNAPGGLMLPVPEEQFDLWLFDASGKEVPKTKLGAKQGKPLSLQGKRALLDWRRHPQIRHLFIGRRDATHCLDFDLNAYFDIQKPGKYRLLYQQRLYRAHSDGQVEQLSLPTVMMPIEIFVVPSDG